MEMEMKLIRIKTRITTKITTITKITRITTIDKVINPYCIGEYSSS